MGPNIMQRAMVPTMIAVVAGNSNMCPSSPGDPHAQTSVEVTAFATCDKVLQEIEARIQANSQGSWLDPYNGGHYFLDSSNSQQLDAHRETGSASIPQGGPFRDNLRFKLHQNGANCFVAVMLAAPHRSMTSNLRKETLISPQDLENTLEHQQMLPCASSQLPCTHLTWSASRLAIALATPGPSWVRLSTAMGL